MFEKLAKFAAKQLDLDIDSITPESTFESLGIELEMEDEKIATFQDLANFVESKLN